MSRDKGRNRGSVTLETAIIFPILIVFIVVLLNLMVVACKTSIQVSEKLLKNTKKWSESAPGKSWSGVKNEIN